MSEFAFFRFKSTNMLTLEEEQHKDEVVKLTEEVLDAKGIECDARIAKISHLLQLVQSSYQQHSSIQNGSQFTLEFRFAK